MLRREIAAARSWSLRAGIDPFWWKQANRQNTFNARSEEALTKPCAIRQQGALLVPGWVVRVERD